MDRVRRGWGWAWVGFGVGWIGKAALVWFGSESAESAGLVGLERLIGLVWVGLGCYASLTQNILFKIYLNAKCFSKYI